MDIDCPNCGEPWDTYHLQHDEPFEWALADDEAKRVVSTGSLSSVGSAVDAARAAGWDFVGDSLLAFTRCPSCASRPSLPVQSVAARRAEVMGAAIALRGDEDGLASFLAS